MSISESALNAGFRATLQHAEILDQRRQRLEEAQLEAEEQVLHRAGLMRRSGELDFDGLYEIFCWFKRHGLPRCPTRWDANMDIPWKRVEAAARHRPNGPEGTWIGEYPLGGKETAPREGTAVLYVLFDETNEPCYVGSTDNLRQRLKAHATAGKRFTRWQAYRSDDREAAYQLEERCLWERLPPLNRRRGR